MYVETDNLKNLEFVIKSEIPVQEMVLKYSGTNASKTEVYVPFNTSEGSWQVIAPRPHLSGPFNVSVTIRDAADREVMREFSVDFGHKIYLENGAKIVKSSQNERFLLTSNYKGLVKVIDLASNGIAFNFDAREEVAFADISPSGNQVALSLNKQTLVIDITTGKVVELRKGLKNSKVAFISDDELIGIDNYKTILVFNSRSGDIKRSIESTDKITSWIQASPTRLVAATHSHKIIEADLDPARSTLFQLTECKDGTIDTVAASTSLKKIAFNCGQNAVVYTRETNSIQTLYSHGDGVRTIEFSPDEQWLSSGTAAGEWRIHNLVDGRYFPKDRVEALEKSFRFKSSVNTIEFSADSSFVSAGADDGEIHIFSVENAEVIQSIATEGRIQQGGWLNQKRVYFAGSQDGSIRLIEVKASDKVIELSEKVENISVNNKLFAVGTSLSAEAVEGILPGAHLYSLETFTEIAKISHKKKVNSALISNNEDWFLTASEDGRAQLMNIASREVIDVGDKLRRPEAPVRAAFFSSSGQKFGLISDNITSIFSAANPENPLLSVISDDWTSAASFSLFDRYLVTAAADNYARIIDAETGSVLGRYEAQSWIWNAKVSNDGRYFANINWDNQLIIQQIIPNTLTGRVELGDYLKIDLQTSGENLSFSSDARYLAFSLWDGSTYLIDLPSKQVILLTCLQGDFASPAIFSKSGELVAVGQDNSAVVYRTIDGKPIQLIRHGDRVTSIGFGGDSVITGGWDGKIKINKLSLTEKANCSFAR
jgi:WD40 repeat protein